MSDKKIREDLEQVASYQRNMPNVRAQAVEAARKSGMTWREIASILDMTEHGVIKAQRAYEDRQESK